MVRFLGQRKSREVLTNQKAPLTGAFPRNATTLWVLGWRHHSPGWNRIPLRLVNQKNNEEERHVESHALA